MEELQAVLNTRLNNYVKISTFFSRLFTKPNAPKEKLILVEHVLKTTNLPRPNHIWGEHDIPQH